MAVADFASPGEGVRRGWRWKLTGAILLGAGSLVAGPLAFIGTAGATPTTLWVSSTTGSSGNPDTSCATAKYTAIQTAVTAAAATDVIMVCPGTYSGGVVIPATLTGLTLDGAQHTTDAVTDSAPTATRSILTSTGASSNGIQIDAAGVTVSGFTIKNVADLTSDVTGGDGVRITPSDTGGVVISDNVITNNVTGINLNNAGPNEVVVEDNVISDNAEAGSASGDGIYSTQGLSDVRITGNLFQAYGMDTGAAIVLVGTRGTQNTITISDNTFTSPAATPGGSAMAFLGVTGLSIVGNTIDGTGPLATHSDGIAFLGADSTVTVTGNVIETAGGYAINFLHYATPVNSDITVEHNTLAPDTLGGVNVTTDGYTGTVTAQGNWWGSASGPTPAPATVDSTDWLVSPATTATVPSPPLDVVATAVSGSPTEAVVTWAAPATNGDTPIVSYTVTALDLVTDVSGPSKTVAVSAPRSATITGLNSGDDYTFTVTAKNAKGTSAPSASSAVFGPTATGYDLVGSDGGVFVFDAPGQSGGFYGSLPGIHVTPNKPVVGMVPTTTDDGYFLVAADGGVFAFGTAPFLGSLPGIHVTPAAPIVGIIAANTDTGYYLVGADGGVFAFGTAPYLGSLPGNGKHVDNVVGIASTPDASGYWVVQATGTVTAFGTAESFTTSATTSPVTAIAGKATGKGYWLVTKQGAVYPYGSAAKLGTGTLPAIGVAPYLPIIGIVPTASTTGYWLLGQDGGIFAFGTAPYYGSLPGLAVHVANIVGAVPN